MYYLPCINIYEIINGDVWYSFSLIIPAEASLVSPARARRTRAESLIPTLTSLSLPFLLVKWRHLETLSYTSNNEQWESDKPMKENSLRYT